MEYKFGRKTLGSISGLPLVSLFQLRNFPPSIEKKLEDMRAPPAMLANPYQNTIRATAIAIA